MPPDESRLEQLFHAALDLPVGERPAYLDHECGADTPLRAKLERLLAADEQSAGFLQSAERDAPSDERLAPRRVGPFQIIRKLGEGGMGIVYEARQESPARTVALKIVRPGLVSPAVARRFKHETQVLGQLQHPGIACIHDAGVAELIGGDGQVLAAGVQYFAMEYIRGQSLSEFAAARSLSTRQRLALLASICDAVDHAHLNGVIHRDLKPANILVVSGETDAPPSPKILDFGIARLTDADMQAATQQTELGQLIGTVPYMSPEQVSGDSRQVDRRSDVYALGVILYELLTGCVPIDVGQRSIVEAARIIREQEPTRPSSHDSRFRGDIDTIVARALEKEKDRRYASAAGLAADIRRHLADQPIHARPQTTWYRLRKFTRRNRVAVASALTVFVTLVAGIAGTGVGLVRALRSAEFEAQHRARADAQARTARAVTRFLSDDLLAAASPYEKGKDVTVREVVDAAAKSVGDQFKNEPLVEAGVRLSLGSTYLALGLLDTAEPHLLRAAELRAQVLGPDDDDTIAARQLLARLRGEQGRLSDAEAMHRELLERQSRPGKAPGEAAIRTMFELANVYRRQGRLRDAERLFRELLAARENAHGSDDSRTLAARGNLIGVLQADRRVAEAAPLIEQTLAAQERTLGADNPYTLYTRGNLALSYQLLDRLADAERAYQQTLEGMTRVFGGEHPYVLFTMGDLCLVYEKQKRFDEVERIRGRVVEGLTRAMGADHPETLISREKLGDLYFAQRRFDDAEPLFVAAYEAHRILFGPWHAYTRASQLRLARTLLGQLRLEECDELLEPLVGFARDSCDAKLYEYLAVWGALLDRQGRAREAESILIQASDAPAATIGLCGPVRREALETLARLYQRSGNPHTATE